VTSPRRLLINVVGQIGDQTHHSQRALFRYSLGISVETLVQVATNAEEEIVGLANDSGFDLLVIGASNRPLTNRPFFGHRVSYILQHANIPVAIVALHSRLDRGSQG
jgi:nucleotide-binding universal stress UspA family protein